MENFIEFKEALIEEAVSKEACESQVQRALTCDSWDELKVVIADNIRWIRDNKVKIPDGHYKSSLGEFTIVNGVRHGEYKEYYQNGRVKVQEHYKNGLLDGEWKVYYENGELMVHCTYKDGELHGERKVWNSSGQLMVHCTYKNGVLHGEKKVWNPDGFLVIHEHYENNKIVKPLFKLFNLI